jgi:phospholipid transport system substrate-binding protein
MRTIEVSLTTVALALCLAIQAWAGTPTDRARQYTDEVLKVLDDPGLKPAERRAAVKKIAVEIFDVSETARRALGRHWQSRTPAEREEFVRLFADLLGQTYLPKISFYEGERVQYVAESIDGDYAVVRARVLRRPGDIPVEARMLRRGDRWYIYDVVVEGISLVNNYRSQFDKIIQTASFPELIQRLRARVDSLDGKGVSR